MDQREDVDLIEPGAAPESPALATPAPEPAAPAPTPKGDAIDQLLAEYQQAFPTPAPSEPVAEPSTPDPQQQIDQLLQDQQFNRALDGADRDRAAQVDAYYQGQIAKAQLAQQFEGHCARGQEKLPDWTPEGYYRSALIEMASADPRLEIAFQAQQMGVSQAAARVKLDEVNRALLHAANNPLADPKVIPSLQRMKWELEVAYHARTIMLQADAAIRKKATARAPIDSIETADREAVYLAVKAGGGPAPVEKPVYLGNLSEAEFRRHTRENYGF